MTTNIDFELVRDRQATLRREADVNRLAGRARRRRSVGAGRPAHANRG